MTRQAGSKNGAKEKREEGISFQVMAEDWEKMETSRLQAVVDITLVMLKPGNWKAFI